MNERIKNQSGGAMLVVVFMVSIAMVTLFYAAQERFQQLNRAVNVQRQRIIALQVMQEFALLAERANAKFERCVGANPACPASVATCPAGTTRMAGRRFCWSTGFVGECVRHPDPAVQQICLSVPAQMTITQSDEIQEGDLIATVQPASGFQVSWRERLRTTRDVLALAWEEAKSVLSETAHAQADLHLPTLAGAPGGSNITPIVCNGGTPANHFCKRCPPSAGLPMRECLSLRVCLINTGCPTPENWFIQRIGINDR